MIVLYTLFALSVFCPIYTYALYPIVLKMLRGKQYKSEEYEPVVTVLVVGRDAENKIKNIQKCEYSNIEILEGNYSDASKVKGEIILFTDTKTEIDPDAIREIVKPFADERVGAVVGQQTNPEGNSAFWKYENQVKILESKIGCVSGANESIFAVRKSALPEVGTDVRNKLFYIATKITESGGDVVFKDSAKAYEGKTEEINFRKHLSDATGYWQALRLFPKMLIIHHGSFVYVGHRVMKWFVWLNMLIMLLSSGLLAGIGSTVMAVLFGIQVFGYLAVIVLGRKNIAGSIGKFLRIGYYFVMLNISYLVGLFR